jgi:conjugal transfer pilus assembly protein TraF
MNKKKGFKMVLGLSLCLKTLCVQAAFFEHQAEGWHWYHTPDRVLEEPKEPEVDQTPLMVFKTPSQIVKAYQKGLEERLHRAWVFPSFENVKAYQVMQQDLMQRSEAFSKTWMQVVYQTPTLDYSLQFPLSHKARHVYLDQQKNQAQAQIKALAQEYGLLFFFDADCAYCRMFAPIVRQFSEQYGFSLLAISPDGRSLPELKEAQADNGLMQELNIEMFPTLLALNPKTQALLPLSYGFSSLDTLEERLIRLIADPTKEPSS